jgi:hypothetical protein
MLKNIVTVCIVRDIKKPLMRLDKTYKRELLKDKQQLNLW